MKKALSLACIPFLAVLLNSCVLEQEGVASTTTDDPELEVFEEQMKEPLSKISDGFNDGGNPHFFFLRPLRSPKAFEGEFDENISPEVEVCIWDGSNCNATLALFTRESGHLFHRIRVHQHLEMYWLLWRTGDMIGQYPLGPDQVYRIIVRAEGKVLGYADLSVVTRWKDKRGIDRKEFVPVRNRQTMLIAFRIEEGALQNSALANADVGHRHSCAIDPDGKAFCWGQNMHGQLGIGHFSAPAEPVTVPTPVVGDHSFQSLKAGIEHTCALDMQGKAWCWGNNFLGQLGNGVTENHSSEPRPVAGDMSFVSIAAGGYHTCALTETGELYCWGFNSFGQFGTGMATGKEPFPVRSATGLGLQSVEIGWHHTCAVTLSDEAWCWGYNAWGQLGGGSAFPSSASPVKVLGAHDFSQLALGISVSCGLDKAGQAWCWGDNSAGAVGDGSGPGSRPSPSAVSGNVSYNKVSAGGHGACGILQAGEAFCWGANQTGQLGVGNTMNQPLPMAMSGEHQWNSLDMDMTHSCGSTLESEIYCWGSNADGQLGPNAQHPQTVPHLVVDMGP